MTDPSENYRQLLRIRRFEETVLDSFSRGLIYGTTHTYLGQEANGVGVLSGADQDDIVVSNHRNHGHFLAYGGPMEGLAAELMGRSTGVCGGRGGSQHIHWRNFYASGVLGGTLPLAAGMAKAEKIRSSGAIVFVFMGDGTLGEGVVYETMNMASLWKLPLLFVIENNRYAQSTPIELNMAGEIADRFAAFDIPVETLDSTDVEAIHTLALKVIENVRAGGGPAALLLHTYRFGPHSKGDDSRDPQEVAGFRERDPISLQAAPLEAELRTRIEQEVDAEIEAAFESASQSPFPAAESLEPVWGD